MATKPTKKSAKHPSPERQIQEIAERTPCFGDVIIYQIGKPPPENPQLFDIASQVPDDSDGGFFIPQQGLMYLLSQYPYELSDAWQAAYLNDYIFQSYLKATGWQPTSTLSMSGWRASSTVWETAMRLGNPQEQEQQRMDYRENIFFCRQRIQVIAKDSAVGIGKLSQLDRLFGKIVNAQSVEHCAYKEQVLFGMNGSPIFALLYPQSELNWWLKGTGKLDYGTLNDESGVWLQKGEKATFFCGSAESLIYRPYFLLALIGIGLTVCVNSAKYEPASDAFMVGDFAGDGSQNQS